MIRHKDIMIQNHSKLFKAYAKLIRPEEWLTAFIFVISGAYLSEHLTFSNLSVLGMIFLPFFLIGCFGFIINDIFDAKYDKMSIRNRNPLTYNLIKTKIVFIFALFLGGTGLAFALFFLPSTFLLFLVSLVLLILYSMEPFRLKEKAGFGIVVHALPVSALFLIGYAAIMPITFPVVLLSISVFLFSLAGGLVQEIRDYNTDKKSGFITTAIFLGLANSVRLVKIFIATSLIFLVLVLFSYFSREYMLLLIPILASTIPSVLIIFPELKPEIDTKKVLSVSYLAILLFIASSFGSLLLFFHFFA